MGRWVMRAAALDLLRNQPRNDDGRALHLKEVDQIGTCEID
jgi:hypothetical protein